MSIQCVGCSDSGELVPIVLPPFVLKSCPRLEISRDAVDLPGVAVRQHAVELVPFPGVQTRDPLIGVDVDQFPVPIFPMCLV